MKPSLPLAVAGAFVAGALAAAAAADAFPRPARTAGASRYTNGTYNFSLTPPDFAKADKDVTHTVATFFAPAQAGFANNLGVLVQNIKTTADEYIELSQGDFKKLGLKVAVQKKLKVSGRDAVYWEYEGVQQRQPLKWMSLAVVDTERVYLLTGTAPASTYDGVAKEFQASIDSFRLAD